MNRVSAQSRTTTKNHVLAIITARLLAVGESEGLDGDVLLADAGLSREDVADPDRYVSLERHVALGASMTRRLGPVNAGLHSGANIYGDPRGALGFAIRRSGTHERALARFCRFFELTNPASSAWVEESQNAIELRVQMAPGLVLLGHPMEALLSAWVAIARIVTKQHWVPQRVTFTHAPIGPVMEHAEFFGCPVVFDAGHSGIVIGRDSAQASIQATEHPFDGALAHLEARAQANAQTKDPASWQALLQELVNGGIDDAAQHDPHLIAEWSVRFLERVPSLPRFEAAFLFGYASVLELVASLEAASRG